MTLRKIAVAAVAAILVLLGDDARACGVSASGTPGLCDASAAIDEKRALSRDRVGASYGYTNSVLFFSDGFRAPTERHVAMASWEHPLPSRWTFSVTAGALLGGHLATATFRPGFLAAVSLSHLLVAPSGYAKPFLLSSFTIAGMYAQTAEAEASATTDYTAFDFSFGLTAGVAVRPTNKIAATLTTITPYIAGRLFGGPVFWAHQDPQTGNNANVLGTDAYKYSLGPGLALSLFRSRFALYLDGSVFGERNVKVGASVSF